MQILRPHPRPGDPETVVGGGARSDDPEGPREPCAPPLGWCLSSQAGPLPTVGLDPSSATCIIQGK